MGLLKHVLLPLFTVADSTCVYNWIWLEDYREPLEWWGRDLPNQPPMTQLELHFMHAIAGATTALAFNNVMAIWNGNSFHRGSALAMHLVFLGIDMWSYHTLKPPIGIPPALIGIVVVGIVGLVVHSREPGVFTQDKNNQDNKKD